jgi:hypothetical protein
MSNSIMTMLATVPAGRPKRKLLAQAVTAFLAICGLTACHVQWVSPYSADLQKKASDMSADVVTWESHMRSVAGTAAADPRHPDVQAKLASWQGTIEAMGQIELSIDPGSTACDRVLAAISGKISGDLKSPLSSTPAAVSSDLKPITHCETLPNIFTRMTKQVSGDTVDSAGIPFVLDQQCKLPWLSDAYFTTLQEARATAGASSPARPVPPTAKAGTPTDAQQADAIKHCQGLFVPEKGTIHGNLVDSLSTDLAAIVYREGREAPAATK